MPDEALRIALDIDGILYHWEKTARYMLRQVLPNSPYTEDGPLGQESTHWNYIEEHVSPDHWKWLWTTGVRLGLFRYGHLYPGTIEAVRRLAKKGDVVLITHRRRSSVPDTLAWAAYQKFPLSGIHILTDGAPKSSVMPQCDVYLDDRIENCADLAQNTTGHVFMMDRPWNRGVLPPGTTRVHDWKEFEAQI